MEQAAQVKKQFAGTALRNDKFHLQKKILLAWNRARLHSPSPPSLVSMLVHFHKMPFQVDKAVKGDVVPLGLHTFRNFPEKK